MIETNQKCYECYECSLYMEFNVCNGYNYYCGKTLNYNEGENNGEYI